MRIYSSNIHAIGRGCAEHYDHGFLISGFVHTEDPAYYYGWILKTDVNGIELWRKTFKDSMKLSGFFGLRALAEGGFIAIGSSVQSDPYHDPLIMKFNACGEKEWCKIFNSPENFDYGMDIEPVHGGGYMALINYWGFDKSKRIWIFKLDEYGDLMWQQAYALDTLFYNEDAFRLSSVFNTNVLITGYTYWPDSIPPNYYFLTPLLIKVYFDGTIDWELPWGEGSEFLGHGNQSISSNHSSIYTVCQHSRDTSPYGTSPTLIKTNTDGNQLGYINILDSTNNTSATTIDWFQDSCLAIGAGWQMLGTSQPKIGVFKVDTAGNLLQEKVLLTSFALVPNDACVTQDNKLFLIASIFEVEEWKWKVYAFKLNSDLEYDSIYTQPFVYDSICPYPISSDTILLDDCEVITSIKKPEEYEEESYLKVYPNPAEDQITIEMPDYLFRRSSGQGITATTIYHQWKDVRLEVFDLFGKLMHCETVPQQRTSITLDIASWPPGMYVARLVFMNEVVAREKFVVE